MSDYMSVNEARSLTQGQALVVKDVSGHDSFGYNFAIFASVNIEAPIPYARAVGEPLATSLTVFDPLAVDRLGNVGAYRAVFNRQDVEALISPVSGVSHE